MDSQHWVTTPLPARTAATLAVLESAGLEIGPPPSGSTRLCIGSVDVDEARIGAVAVMDLDRSGSALLRGVAGDASRLTGLPDALRATGARRLLAADPLPLEEAGGWRPVVVEPPLWVLEL